ncbi:MAG: hypothetical protein WBE20_00455 [Candidatus Acidiferrales bacterium]
MLSIHTKKMKIAAAIVFLAIAIFLPEVVSAGWHVAHGKTVTFRGWKVDVPFEWYARSHGEDMTVERMSRLSWRQDPIAVFQPVHFTKTYPFQYELYGKEQALVMRAKGYLLSGQQDLEIAGKGGRCWTFNAWNNRDNLWIACIVPKDLTAADYIGTRAYAPNFFSVLSQIKTATP